MLLPLFILALGSLIVGYIFKDIFIQNTAFWSDSIKFLEPLSDKHPPNWFLYLTPILVVASIPLSFYLFIKNKKLLNYIVEINQPLHKFLKNKWYFDELYNFIFVKPSKFIGYFFWKKIDDAIINKFGPDGISYLIKLFSLKAVKFQTGFIYQYAFIMLLGFSLILTILMIN
tara:strand:- start:353 stop:868 length:516 start_codon:yes stop_codon:yes gene_type:complete